MAGEFKGFNQGEFYLYSPDGGIRKLDTIAVKNGRFTYQLSLDTAVTLVMVFPNYSEMPVFAAPNARVEIKGDASHLKETEVKGTKENELMTAFRLKTSELMPPEVVRFAAAFIKENPDLNASIWLLNKYFISTQSPDYKRAATLATTILKARPGDKRIVQLKKNLESLRGLSEGAKLPKFMALDIKRRPISNADLYAKVNVITTWASWNYESMSIQRQLKRLEREKGSNNLKIVSFCLDADAKKCKEEIDRDSITWSNVCDGQMWETKALIQLGLGRVPDNIITNSNGVIIAHSIPLREMKQKIEQLLE